MAALSISILSLIISTSSNDLKNIEIDFTGNSFFSSKFLLPNFKFFKNPQDIELYIKHILDQYNDAGFPFCSIRPEFIEVDTTTKKLILHIDEGERVVIKDYIFKTDGKTDIEQLKRIVRIKKDQYFSLRNLNSIKKTILKTNAFKGISETILKKDNYYYLLFDLKEKASDYIIAGGSFAEANNYFSAEFYSFNIFGTLRQFQFRYESSIFSGEDKKVFQINFTEPVFLNPVIFNTTLYLQAYDSARLAEFNSSLDAPLNPSFDIILISGVEVANYLTDSNNYSYMRTILGIGSEFRLNEISKNLLKFDYLFRDNKRLRIFYDGVIEFSHFFIKPHYYLVVTEKFEYFDYIRLGGAKNLRGYLEDEFLLKQALWVNFEYKRFPFYPLIDIGYLDGEYLYSYGTGIDARTNLAKVSLIFALPAKGNLRDGKVHILLEKNL